MSVPRVYKALRDFSLAWPNKYVVAYNLMSLSGLKDLGYGHVEAACNALTIYGTVERRVTENKWEYRVKTAGKGCQWNDDK